MMERDARDDGKGKGKKEDKQQPIRDPKSAWNQLSQTASAWRNRTGTMGCVAATISCFSCSGCSAEARQQRHVLDHLLPIRPVLDQCLDQVWTRSGLVCGPGLDGGLHPGRSPSAGVNTPASANFRLSWLLPSIIKDSS